MDSDGVGQRAGRAIARPVRSALRRAGLDLVRVPAEPAPKPVPPDLDDTAREIVERVRPFTMTPPDRVAALIEAARYIARTGLPGAVVECGVWRGGSMMAAALTLLSMGVDDVDLFLFDAFGKMPMPSDRDVDAWGRPASRLFEDGNDANAIPELAIGPVEGVRRNLESTGYPSEHIQFVQGMVEDTVPAQAPEQIALLRLDTDWYASTAHEMRHLFPRIVDGGVLIIDDYGLFQGARDAVDEYLAECDIPILLNRVDFAARVAVVHRQLRA